MPILQVNAAVDTPRLPGGGDLAATLREALAGVPQGAPVVVMIHGYKFSPFDPVHCPHKHILSPRPARRCWKAISWPRHLGFGRGLANEGLCIAFGWDARGTIWRAWDSAAQAGLALADLIRVIRKAHGGPVDLVGHSLGARVALAAMADLPARSLGRVVLMAAAEFQGNAVAALAAPGARGAEVINITSRENDLFDLGLECFLREGRALGAGLGQRAQGWLDVQMDCDHTRAVLGRLGYRIPPPVRRVCHWSAYLRPGLFLFYRDLIRRREALPLAMLRQRLPARPTPRWSRLLPVMAMPWPGKGAGLQRS